MRRGVLPREHQTPGVLELEEGLEKHTNTKYTNTGHVVRDGPFNGVSGLGPRLATPPGTTGAVSSGAGAGGRWRALEGAGGRCKSSHLRWKTNEECGGAVRVARPHNSFAFPHCTERREEQKRQSDEVLDLV